MNLTGKNMNLPVTLAGRFFRLIYTLLLSIPIGTQIMVSRGSVNSTGTVNPVVRALLEKVMIKLDIAELVLKSTLHIDEIQVTSSTSSNSPFIAPINAAVAALADLRETIIQNYSRDAVDTGIGEAVKNLRESVAGLNRSMNTSMVGKDHQDILFEALRALEEAVKLLDPS